MKRWFAVVYKTEKYGYALDYYPEEKVAYESEEGEAIVGEFATPEEARRAVRNALTKGID